MIVQPINCTLKSSGESSTDAMIAVMKSAFGDEGATVAATIRAAAFDIKPGVISDEGDGDAWPHIRDKILATNVLILGTPIRMGSAGRIAKRVMKRMDAFLEETDDQGRMPSYGKVAVAAIVGNEDGAHFASAQIFQALNDVSWTIPAVAACYWVGEVMGSTDFKDLDETPEMVTKTARMVASNAVHLAGVLKKKGSGLMAYLPHAGDASSSPPLTPIFANMRCGCRGKRSRATGLKIAIGRSASWEEHGCRDPDDHRIFAPAMAGGGQKERRLRGRQR